MTARYQKALLTTAALLLITNSLALAQDQDPPLARRTPRITTFQQKLQQVTAWLEKNDPPRARQL